MGYDFQTFKFSRGKHKTREDGLCLLEAVAYIAGEAHTDRPDCVEPLLGQFFRCWNDGLASDDERQRLFSSFVFRLPGTRTTLEIAAQRWYMGRDWLFRTILPKFFDKSPIFADLARQLRSLPEITVASQKSEYTLTKAEDLLALAIKDSVLLNYGKLSIYGMHGIVDVCIKTVLSNCGICGLLLDDYGRTSGIEEDIFTIMTRILTHLYPYRFESFIDETQISAADLADRMIKLTEIQEVVPQKKLATACLCV